MGDKLRAPVRDDIFWYTKVPKDMGEQLFLGQLAIYGGELSCRLLRNDPLPLGYMCYHLSLVSQLQNQFPCVTRAGEEWVGAQACPQEGDEESKTWHRLSMPGIEPLGFTEILEIFVVGDDSEGMVSSLQPMPPLL